MHGAQIVIIGGGVVGGSIAYHMACRGVTDVRILERASEQGTGSTGKATGGIRAQFGTDVNIAMSLYSMDFFQNCEFDCGYDPKGYLFLAKNEEQFATLRCGAEKQRGLGYDGVEILDVGSILKIVPGLRCDDIVGGSFGSRDGFIDPVAVMHGFTWDAIERGAKIQFDTDVTKIDVLHGRVRSVETNRGSIECDAIVLCAGAWSRSIAATAGVDLPVEPLRRQTVWAQTREPLTADLPMVIEMGSGFHFRPARDFGISSDQGQFHNRVLFAYPDPEEKPSFSTEFDETFIERVLVYASHRASFLDRCEVVPEKCRAGLYENSPDHHAILGGCDVEGLYLACGFSGHGVMHSPATGRALAEIILDGEVSFLDLSCLGLDRFRTGSLLHETSYI